MSVGKQAPGSPLAVISNTVRDVCTADWYRHHTKMTMICTTCSAVLHKRYCADAQKIIQRLLYSFAKFFVFFSLFQGVLSRAQNKEAVCL